MRSKSIVLIALFFAVLSATTLAQTVTGFIGGTVIDATGASIPDANVSITNQNQNFTLRTKADAQGRFAFPTVQPGNYNVTVEAKGFKSYQQTGLILHGNEKIGLGSLTLQVGQASQQVEVSAQTNQLQTESAERSAQLNSKQMQNLAVNGRSYLPLVALTPGVTTYPDLPTAGHGGVGSMSVNGARENQNNLTVDGVGNVDTGNNGDQLATVSLDSVEEFRMQTSNYQAEYGRSSGSQISVVTKSGSRDFHGSGYLFHRNDGLNANNWYNNRQGLQKQLYRYNDAGYTIGGPIYIPKLLKTRDKLFFFFSQEYQNQLNPQSVHNVTVPTALERQGDFSQSVDKNGAPFNLIRDPQSGKPCTATNTAGCFQYQGVLGRIDPTRLNPFGLAILNAYPLPNAQSIDNKGYNYTSQISDSYPRRETLLKGDWNINDKNKAFVRWIHNKDAVTSNYGSFVLGTSIPKVPITDSRPGEGVAVGVISVINATTTNEARWGYGKNTINIDPTTDGLTRTANNLSNIPILYPGAVKNDFMPNINDQGFNGTRLANTGGWGTSDAPFFNYNTTIELTDSLSKVWGSHAAKFGAYFQRSRKDQTSFACANGCFDFSDNPSNPYDTGFGFANAAAGVYNTFSQASAYLTGQYRYTNFEWYAQDTWKIRPRFTLDYGLRFYYIQPQYDAAKQTSNFLPDRWDPSKTPRLYQPYGTSADGQAIDPATGAILPAYAIGKIVPNSGDPLNGIYQAGKGIPAALVKTPPILLSPRFGFAWDVTGRSNIVVRAGGGIFYDRFQGNIIFDELTNPPATYAPTLTYGYINPTFINANNALLGPAGLIGLDYQGKIPTTGNYSFGIQWKLPGDFVLDTAYVGSRSWHLQQKLNLNAIPYGATFLPQNQDPTKPSSGSPDGSNALPADFLRPYAGYGDIALHESGGTANYNSFQVGLNHNFTHGLQFGLAYTYGKALGTSSGDGDYNRIDNLERFANYGPLSFDRRHTVAINYVYQIPALFRNRAVLHTTLDGWQISGITRMQTGAPYEVGFSLDGYNNQKLTGSYTEGPRVQVTGDPLKGTSDDPYNRLTAAAFAPPPVGNVGIGEGRNPFTGPGINQTDLSLSKFFAIKERLNIQLRADAFNFANHTQFNGINSTINFSGTPGNYKVTNAYLNSDGSLNNINGFGTVSGARNPRIVQLVVRVTF